MCFKQACYNKDEMTLEEAEELWKQLEEKRIKEDKMIRELTRK